MVGKVLKIDEHYSSSDGYIIDEGLTADEASMMANCIDTYNAQQTGFTDECPLKLVARDSEGNLLGGLMGSTGFQWLYIHILERSQFMRKQLMRLS